MSRGRVVNDKLPRKCPKCGNLFIRPKTEKSIIEYMYDFVTGRDGDKGYYECDSYGFIKGEELPFPEDKLDMML
jgi:hypothetical protein